MRDVDGADDLVQDFAGCCLRKLFIFCFRDVIIRYPCWRFQMPCLNWQIWNHLRPLTNHRRQYWCAQIAMPMPERRRSERTNPDEIVYVDMGPENGGIVLNVSEGGLAFCAAIPIRQTEPIHFSLVFKGRGRMDGAGEVAWIDKSRKMCGLRLSSDSWGGSERLSRWATATQATTLAPPLLPFAPPEVETPAVIVPDDVVSPLPLLSEPAPTGPAPKSPKLERGPFDPLTAEDLASMSPGLGLTVETVLPAMVVAVLVAVLVAATYFSGTRSEKSRVEASDYSGAISYPEPKALAAKHAKPERGQAELDAALEYLRAPGQPDTTSATRLLQSAVKSGNSSAGVLLAEMYLSGEGIRKNCTDAGALLTAASKNGNIEASVKLKELVVKGCR